MRWPWHTRRNPTITIVAAAFGNVRPERLIRRRTDSGVVGVERAGYRLAIRVAGLVVLLCLLRIPAVAAGQASVLILDFELNDLTLNPDSPQEHERVASLRPLLAETLAAKYGYRIAEIDARRQAQANGGFGYLFDHHDAAAELGRSAGADWVVVGRVHKASFLFVYFMVHLIEAKTGQLAGDFIVEVKGPQKRLTIKGVERLAAKLDATLRGRAAAYDRTNQPISGSGIPGANEQR